MLTPYSNIISVTTLAFDTDYQAVLNYATSQSYTLPSASQQILQNQLVLDLKAGGIWSKLDTLAIFATDGSSDFALIDWKRLSQYTAVNSPTFTANQGFQGNGTSSYIDTIALNTFSGANNYKLNDASAFAYLFTNTAGSALIGNNSGNPRIFSGLGNFFRLNSTNIGFNVDFSGTGLMVANKTASNTHSWHKNTTNYSGSGGGDIDVGENLWVLRSAVSYSSSRVSLVGAGASLNSQHTDLYNAINTYITSI